MKIKITVVDQKGELPCHRGHKIGDTFDYDKDSVDNEFIKIIKQ